MRCGRGHRRPHRAIVWLSRQRRSSHRARAWELRVRIVWCRQSGTPYDGAQTTFDTTNQLTWDWIYCFEQELKWFICWGIAGAGRYGPISYDIKFDEPLQAFVVIATDNREIPMPKVRLQSLYTLGWKAYELPSSKKLRLVKAVAPDVLLETGSTFNLAFEDWATRTADEALKILHAAHEDINKDKRLSS